MRTWTSATGIKIEARLLTLEDKIATLQKKVGGEIKVPACAVRLEPGDSLALLVDARNGEHTCDMTEVGLTVAEDAVEIAATIRSTGQTGGELEALTAASVAALTVYDMCKSIDRGMRIDAVRVTHKAGGKSGEFVQD